MLAKLRAAADVRGIDLASIRITDRAILRTSTGARSRRRLRASLLGMSESFAAHSAEPITDACPTTRSGAAGRAVNGIERRVVDPKTGEEVPAGEIGELQLRGGALMTGFYKVDPRDGVHTRRLLSRPRTSCASTPTATHSSSVAPAT